MMCTSANMSCTLLQGTFLQCPIQGSAVIRINKCVCLRCRFLDSIKDLLNQMLWGSGTCILMGSLSKPHAFYTLEITTFESKVFHLWTFGQKTANKLFRSHHTIYFSVFRLEMTFIFFLLNSFKHDKHKY